MADNIYVDSEIAELKKVIVHHPDEGIARVSPGKSNDLLFDDIVHYPRMREEHRIFTDIISAFIGEENVMEIATLLKEAIDNASLGDKDEFLDMLISFEELPQSYKHKMEKMGSEQLADVLITGYFSDEDLYMFSPIPNFIFTRDVAVTVHNHIIITKAAKLARQRENLLTRFTIYHHPYFQVLREEDRIINLNLIDKFPPSKRGETVSLEGGDVMLLDREYLLIGTSERTSSHAFQSLKKELFKRDIIKYVVKVEIPDERSFMHIDTIFTRINYNDILAFNPIVIEGLSSRVEVYGKGGMERTYDSIAAFMVNEINENMNFHLSGQGVSPYQEREQWTDSCNMVALKPGIAISYDRNVKTHRGLKDAGYNIVTASELLKCIKTDEISVSEIENTIILLPSAELSRARGGSHCMTCPILRAEL